MQMGAEFHFNKAFTGSLCETRRMLLNRDRVLALDEGLPVFVIEGPSGYGKTSLAEMWLGRQRASATSTCCWVSLDSASRDPRRFLEQLLQAVGADCAGKPAAGLDDEAGCAERFSDLCTRLAEVPAGFCIVIDDAHLLADGASRPYLEQLLGIASNTLRICVTMQPIKLEVGLGRLTAQGQASWVQAKSLALTREEVAIFAELRRQELSPAQLDWLFNATKGWPALTQLALAVPVDAALTDCATMVNGALREYIYERFFRGLSNDDRDVLWTLSCLGSAPVPLLVALDPSPAKVELALLNFRALGIVRNSEPDDGSVVSLHSLIREAASRLMDSDRAGGRPALVRDAAEWYWSNGHGVTAVRLALESGAALVLIAREWLVKLGFSFIFRSGQHQAFLDLVERWEQVSGHTDPEVDEMTAWALIFQRQFALAESRLDRIEATEREKRGATAALQRAVLLSLRDDYNRGCALAHCWIEQAGGAHTFSMGVASTVYAFGQCAGRFDEAQVALREAMYCFNVAESAYGIGWAHVVGSIVSIRVGRYRAALAQSVGGLMHCPNSQGFDSLRALLRALEAFLRYERNELDRVREILGEALPLLADQGVVDAVSLGFGYTTAARARAAAGDFGTALDILSEGEQIGLQRDFPRLTFTLRAERALLLVRSGAASQARTIVDAMPGDGTVRITVDLLRARLALADGDGALARNLLQPILAKARRLGRQGRLCEILLQLAGAEELCGNEAAAFAALAEALDIGSAEGYVRSFLDEGKNTRSLIARWLKHGSASSRPAVALANRLITLGESGADRESTQPASATFNKRERQILSLLNDGLSNAQLAKRCFISEGTVKWYLHNLYEQLGVGNRTALLRAVREQGFKLQ